MQPQTASDQKLISLGHERLYGKLDTSVRLFHGHMRTMNVTNTSDSRGQPNKWEMRHDNHDDSASGEIDNAARGSLVLDLLSVNPRAACQGSASVS